jgi:hypothetical protein
MEDANADPEISSAYALHRRYRADQHEMTGDKEVVRWLLTFIGFNALLFAVVLAMLWAVGGFADTGLKRDGLIRALPRRGGYIRPRRRFNGARVLQQPQGLR